MQKINYSVSSLLPVILKWMIKKRPPGSIGNKRGQRKLLPLFMESPEGINANTLPIKKQINTRAAFDQ
jgi:hypothetical protein